MEPAKSIQKNPYLKTFIWVATRLGLIYVGVKGGQMVYSYYGGWALAVYVPIVNALFVLILLLISGQFRHIYATCKVIANYIVLNTKKKKEEVNSGN